MSWEQRGNGGFIRAENNTKLFWLWVQWHFQSLPGLISSDWWIAMQSQSWALVWGFHCQFLSKNILKDRTRCCIALPVWDSSWSRCRRPWCYISFLRAFDFILSEWEKRVSPLHYKFLQLLCRDCPIPPPETRLCRIHGSELHQGYQMFVSAAEMSSPFIGQKKLYSFNYFSSCCKDMTDKYSLCDMQKCIHVYFEIIQVS